MSRLTQLFSSAVLGLTALSAMPTAVFSQSLAQRLDMRLDEAPFDRHLWGVVMMEMDGSVTYSRNADRLFIPASNTKLVVAAVAAALLPGDWTVTTSVYATGPVVDGEVAGDLVLYGRGDPTFSRRCYATDTTLVGVCMADPAEPLLRLADELRSRGITFIRGDIVGDGSYFEPTMVHPSWEVYDVNWWYAAPVSGLGFNDNSIDITYRPAETVGAPPVMEFYPDFGDLTLENRARTSNAGGDRTIDFYRTPGTLAVWAEGELPADTRERTEYFARPDPNRFTAEAFRNALAQRGISVGGRTVGTTDSLRYRAARQTAALAEIESRPLKDWIFPILNTSQNWFAEMLLKQLGKQFAGEGSWQAGLEVEERFLIDSVGIDSTHFSLADGSGLASSNLVTPLAFAELLRYIRQHPGWPTFVAGLPQSGNRGSLANRFVSTTAEGRVLAKTGSISKVNTLSGYIERDPGSPLIFSVMANHHAQSWSSMVRQIDSVVVDMAR